MNGDRLRRLEDLEHPVGVVIVLSEDRIEGAQVDGRERLVGRIRHGPSRTAER